MNRTAAIDHLTGFRDDAWRRVHDGHYALHGPPLQHNGSLADALSHGAIIAELKPRSPSGGRLLRGDPQDVLDAYVGGGAAAISCLADPDHFGGSPDLVRQAHATGLPVLWKDFVVHADQVRAAAHHGASAILLIEALFHDREERESLVACAHDAGLEVLLEVHDRDEADRARTSRADLFGVNARDLRTLDEDRYAAATVVRLLVGDRPVISLSAIHNRRDVQAAMDAGATAVLVGTALLTDADPELRLRSLRRPLAKVCGVRDLDTVDEAVAAGADLIGVVVLSPHSPRDVTVDEAAALMARIRDAGGRGVLVTDSADAEAIRDALRRCRPYALQLHGDAVDGSVAQALGARFLHAVATPSDHTSEDIVLDASRGKGRTMDLDAAHAAVAAAPQRFTLLAGGLGPDNVVPALQATGATGADASSGLESTPGVKDPERIRAFVEACHGA